MKSFSDPLIFDPRYSMFTLHSSIHPSSFRLHPSLLAQSLL